RGRLLRLAIRGRARARADQRQRRRRALRDGVDGAGDGARTPRGRPERGGLAGLVLFVRDAAARHEVRRARVQGDGPGPLRAGGPWLRALFVFPSCGDESNAVGAAYLGWLARVGPRATPQPFGAAYLGPSLDSDAVEALIRTRDLAAKYRVSEHERVEERIAELLGSDGVVARCAGRMEFGARALGNRSILTNPSDHRVVGVINRMIKNRDFWMPFAPSILR